MPNYTFENLSSCDFENLVRDLLQAEWGIMLESFTAGPDDGIDNRHFSSEDGTTIVQSKQYARSGYRMLLTELEKEVPKVERLNPNWYVVATSVPLTPVRKRDIAALVAPTEEHDVFGRDDLNNLLGKHPLNLELAKKRPECLEFVVVHEMVHLLERSHNDRFVALMDEHLPNWRLRRQELNAAPLANESW